MKILLIGATGFIGKPLVASLVAQGHEVKAIVRDATKARDLPCLLLTFPLNDASRLRTAISGVDVVINLAGEPVAQSRWSNETKASILDSRTQTTRQIVSALGALPQSDRPRAILNASAIGFYGDRKDEVVTEASQKGTGFLSDVCAAWEEEALSARSLGIRVVCLRIGIVLGRNGGALPKMLPMPMGTGKQWMSWIHLQDAVGLIEHAISQDSIEGPLNLVSPEAVTNREFATVLQETSRAPRIPGMRVPTPLLQSILGTLSSVIIEGQKVLPTLALNSNYVFRFPSLKAALSDLIDGDQEFLTWQKIDRPVQDVFAFFSKAENLEVLTPSFLNFRIVDVQHPSQRQHLGTGTLIDYRLKIHQVPVLWRTRIEEWAPNQNFVDTQLKGPYAKWHHTHTFQAMGNSTLMTDRVRYRLPLGFAGNILGGAFVRSDIQSIFDFRRKKIQELFPS